MEWELRERLFAASSMLNLAWLAGSRQTRIRDRLGFVAGNAQEIASAFPRVRSHAAACDA